MHELDQNGQNPRDVAKDLAKEKVEKYFFFQKKNSWVVAPIFDGLDVGIQKMSKKTIFFFAFWLKR